MNTDNKIFPIICLWAHPRSMSTAVERIMRERGEFQCFHEPFMYDYYVHRRTSNMPHFDIDPAAPVSYDEIKSMLLENAQKSPVFIKDMSYYIVPQLFDDLDFAKRITHSFLIRNPMHSILSYFKLDNNVTLEEIGIEAQYRHAHWLQQQLGIAPVVLVAEQIRQNAQVAMTNYWKKLGLEFKPEALNWNSNQSPADWQQVSKWHNNTSNSKQIRKPSEKNDMNREKEFENLSIQHPVLGQYLDHHRPFYEKLKVMASR